MSELPPDLFDALPDPALLLENGAVVRANGRACALIGRDPCGQSVDELLVEGRDAVSRQLASSTDHGPAPTRIAIDRPGNEPLVLEARLVRTDEGWLCVGREAGARARSEEVVSRLSRLYLSHGGQPMVDLDALVAVSRPVFVELRWSVGLFAYRAEGVSLEEVITHPATTAETWDFVHRILAMQFPTKLFPRMGKVVESRRGVWFDDAQALVRAVLRRIEDAIGEDGVAPEILDALETQRTVHGAFAPVFVGDQVQYVLAVLGPDFRQEDFAAVQLYAAQVSATLQLSQLSATMVRQQRLAALGQMSTLLAHEVRNPLAVMFQATRQIGKRVGGSAEVDELLNILEEEARRLSKLVDDLVHFAGPVRPRLEAVSLAQVVRWSVAGARENADFGEELDRVHVAIPDTVPMVRADPLLLRQVVAHLLSNACAHAKQGGRVDLSAAPTEDGRVRFQVLNDGAPLPDDVAMRVFEPFFTTKAAGSGLGLAVVRRLIEDQGGTVTLDRDAPGVSFSVWLPVAPDPTL